MAKRIVTVALTGAVTPHGYDVPETPEQIADCAYECWKAGASVAHLHMRDDEGAGVMDPVRFYQTIKILRTKYPDCDIIVNCTSSGDNRVSDDSPYGNNIRRLHHKIVPGIEMGTFDAGSFNWGIPGGIFSNSPTFLTDAGMLYQERNIKPEFEVFDLSMIRAVGVYWKKGIVKAPLHFQFCLGVVGGMDATPRSVQMMVEEVEHLQAEGNLPKEVTWSGFGIGKGHLPVMYACLANGGHIRVGMEDNVVYGKDKDGNKILANNLMLVQRAVRAIEAYGDEPATGAEAREMFNLAPLDMDATVKALEGITIEEIEQAKEDCKKEFGSTYKNEKGMG
ncbi:MAG: 3-keto-5-aminohexanoate cleavage protein [Eubacterium sp.]|nr:3-keto-5-aminohexanoate cleavage protein [Eubacterium sp.]